MTKHILTGRSILTGEAPGAEAVPDPIVRFVEARPWITRCVVHVAAPNPQGPAAGWSDSPDGMNIAIDVWAADDRALDSTDAPLQQASVYAVEEIVEKGSGQFSPGALPGITLFSRNLPKPGLTAAEVRAGYDRHPLTALRVHVGMDTYVRNCTLSRSPQDAPPLASISVLYFPSEDAFLHGLYESEEGQQEIMRDVEGFMDTSRMMVVTARSHALL